ncbi:LacI family DNA-binding transcriptional regulator [uncultured Limimaricola sp.]|uniref:LacI family DNA-binding transcriptional regulator n=1 Tax=uncultured Limimaricola sp. TaxID=2211667 RepID=UPI0030F8A68E
MAKRVTLAEVTARAGVSPIKVSRALRWPDTVQPETRTRIDAAVAMLGYVPDPAARELAMGRSDVIGVLIP